MLIYRNAKEVHGQRKVRNPCCINLGFCFREYWADAWVALLWSLLFTCIAS